MKKYLYGAAALVSSFVPALAFAEGEQTGATITVTPMVDPTSVQSSLTTMAGQWLVVGLSVGIAIFAVYLGWRILKRFSR